MADFEDEWQESDAPAPRQPRVFRANPDRRDDRNWRDGGSNQQNVGDGGGSYNQQNPRDGGGGYNNRNFGSNQRNYRDGGFNQRNPGEGGSNQRNFRGGSNQRNFGGGGSNQRSFGDGGYNQRSFGDGGNQRNYRDDGNRKVMNVPSDKVGRIIGKGGTKIRSLEYESEARVKIGDSNGETTDVTLSGSDEAISKAESLIKELLEDYKPRQRENFDGNSR